MGSQAGQGNVRFKFIWTTPPSVMAENCRMREARFDPAVLSRLSAMSEELVSYMQANAPWTDRTKAARDGLSSNARITARGNATLTAFHTVPYGGFLETGTVHNAPYPIIKPALEAFYGKARQIMAEIAGSG